MPDRLKILMLEDNTADAEIVHRLLMKEIKDLEFNLVLNKAAFIHALDNFGPNVILADASLPQFSAEEALSIVRQRSMYTPFIMVTGSVSEEFAVGIIKLGADDYILKDRMKRLPAAIDAAIKQQKTEKEKKAAEYGRRKSNERFQTLTRLTKDAVWDWNLLTDEMWWNESFYTLMGYDPLLAAPGFREWTKRIHAADRNKVMARISGVKKDIASSWEDEFRLKRNDGSFGTVLDRAYVLKNESGTPIRVIGVLIDITEQKRLIRDMEVLSMIAREGSNSVMIFNRHTGHTSWVNQGFTRTTGYTKDDLYEKDPWQELSGPETDTALLQDIGRHIGNNENFSVDALVYCKKKHSKWLSITGQPIRHFDNSDANYFVMAADITERRRTEEERLAERTERQKETTRIILETQEIERNNLGRELHDNINQILAAVNLKLALFQEKSDDKSELIDSCRQDLQNAIAETRSLSHNMVMPHFSEKGLRNELQFLIEMHNSNKIIHLRLGKTNEKNLSCAIKETIYRIAQEQLSNIDKHARATKVLIRINTEPGKITMIINDNGIGFDLHQKRKGIGLSNIANRVTAFNGNMNIITLPGGGCTICVTLPTELLE